MSKKDPIKTYTLKTPRESSEWTFHCHADSRMFVKNFADMPAEMQKLFQGKNRISLPCDGGGCVGPWCQDCLFGNADENG